MQIGWFNRMRQLLAGRLCAPMPPNTSAGTLWERRALDYLRQQGLRLVQANFRCRGGEIDLVMRDGAMLVFVEVRQRSGADYGGALASIGPAKQRRLLRAAKSYLLRYRAVPPCRFDVVAVQGTTIEWLCNAIEDSGC